MHWNVENVGQCETIKGDEMSLTIYTTLTSPVLDYADVAYDSLSVENTLELQKYKQVPLKSETWLADPNKRSPQTHPHDVHKFIIWYERRMWNKASEKRICQPSCIHAIYL